MLSTIPAVRREMLFALAEQNHFKLVLTSKEVPCRATSFDSCAGIFKQSIGARNRVGIGLPYRPASLHSLAELVPWNRFLGSLRV
jgi:hypothetical protein